MKGPVDHPVPGGPAMALESSGKEWLELATLRPATTASALDPSEQPRTHARRAGAHWKGHQQRGHLRGRGARRHLQLGGNGEQAGPLHPR